MSSPPVWLLHPHTHIHTCIFYWSLLSLWSSTDLLCSVSFLPAQVYSIYLNQHYFCFVFLYEAKGVYVYIQIYMYQWLYRIKALSVCLTFVKVVAALQAENSRHVVTSGLSLNQSICFLTLIPQKGNYTYHENNSLVKSIRLPAILRTFAVLSLIIFCSYFVTSNSWKTYKT